jgi:predicted nucleic acid-binding protein
VLTSFDRYARLHSNVTLPSSPRVSDGDDQIFVDLALHTGAAWLFSRDKALLHLKRRLAAHGCTVTTPEAAFIKAQSAPDI